MKTLVLKLTVWRNWVLSVLKRWPVSTKTSLSLICSDNSQWSSLLFFRTRWVRQGYTVLLELKGGEPYLIIWVVFVDPLFFHIVWSRKCLTLFPLGLWLEITAHKKLSKSLFSISKSWHFYCLYVVKKLTIKNEQ